MTEIDVGVINRKLAVIEESLELLKPIAALSYREYREKVYYRKAAERLLQTAIEAAIDINNIILVGLGHQPAQDSFSSFLEVADKAGVYEREFGEKLAPSAGLRNRLVHEYNKLDEAVVYTSIKHMLEDYPVYVKAIRKFLKRVEGK